MRVIESIGVLIVISIIGMILFGIVTTIFDIAMLVNEMIGYLFDMLLSAVGHLIEIALLIVGILFIVVGLSGEMEGGVAVASCILGIVLIGLYVADLYAAIAEIIFLLITSFLIIGVFGLAFAIGGDMPLPARFVAASTITAVFTFVLVKMGPILAFIPILSPEVMVLSRIESSALAVESRLVSSTERRILSNEGKVITNAVESVTGKGGKVTKSISSEGAKAAESLMEEGSNGTKAAVKEGAKLVDIFDNGTGQAEKIVERGAKSYNNATSVPNNVKKNTGSTAVNKKSNVEHITTIREDLVNQVHPDTGVKYLKRTVVTPSGIKIEGVFPDFPSIYDTEIPLEMYNATDAVQFNACNKALQEAVKSNHVLRSKFNAKQLEQIANGDRPSGYTWHHNEESGLLQLVPTEIHSKTPHTGGRSIWGGGSEYR
ncbi:HNH endonuclease [Selenomonas sp. AB3002]|uniref:HNH endonuclease n=1 Tax=Selenomonas sp. AB3002 TaxID=1392502 RepID=UPI00163B6074